MGHMVEEMEERNGRDDEDGEMTRETTVGCGHVVFLFRKSHRLVFEKEKRTEFHLRAVFSRTTRASMHRNYSSRDYCQLAN